MIVGTFNKIPKRESSHSYGWARTWSEMLNMPMDQENQQVHKEVYLLHGANFGGGLNLFGGFNEALKKSCDNLMAADKIYSLEIPMPEYGEMLKTRKDVEDKEWCDKLTSKLKSADVITAHDLGFKHLAVGDSHTAAYAPTQAAVIKRDGTTLFGQIKEDFKYIREEFEKGDYESVTISLGNIDIRHHVVRNKMTYLEILEKMITPLNEFGKSLGVPVEYAVPWPIEHEERKLPKSGYYKGQPFWGTAWERGVALASFKTAFKNLDMDMVEYPSGWYMQDSYHYAKEKMEAGGSVHLNPKYYRSQNWGRPEIGLDDFF